MTSLGAKGHVAASAFAMSAATAVSRVLGLVREQVIAALFGAGIATDAYNTAFRIPNLMRDLFAEGALSASFVPVFSERLRNASRSEAFRLTNLVINSLLIVLGAVTILIVVFSRELTWVLASGFFEIPGKAELCVLMTRILSSFLMVVSLAAAVMGSLNALGHFFLPALAPAVFNAVNIAVTLVLAPYLPRYGIDPILALAAGSMIGGIAQLGIQVPLLYREGFRYSPIIDARDAGLRKIATAMIPAVIGMSVTQINVVIDTQIASHFGNGPVTWLNYAFRLIQLPIGLFGVSLATVNLAVISRNLAGGERVQAARAIGDSLKTSFLLNFAATAGLMALAIPIVRVIFEHGRFLPADTDATATAVMLYSLGIAGYAAVKILAPAFYALEDPYLPLKASATAIGIKVAANLALSAFIGFRAVAITTSAAAWINFAILVIALRSRLPEVRGTGVVRSTLRSLTLCSVMGLIVWALDLWLAGFVTLPIRLALVIAAGMVFLFAVGRAMRLEEIDRLWKVVMRRR